MFGKVIEDLCSCRITAKVYSLFCNCWEVFLNLLDLQCCTDRHGLIFLNCFLLDMHIFHLKVCVRQN